MFVVYIDKYFVEVMNYINVDMDEILDGLWVGVDLGGSSGVCFLFFEMICGFLE